MCLPPFGFGGLRNLGGRPHPVLVCPKNAFVLPATVLYEVSLGTTALPLFWFAKTMRGLVF